MSQEPQSAVFGIYSSHAALEAALEVLRAKGFQSSDISVLSAQTPEFASFTQQKVMGEAERLPAGAGAASVVGGTLGWLVGMTALAMAGGIFVVAGPLMAVFAGMGEAVGNIAGALSGIGVPEERALHYEGRVASGGTLLSVHTTTSEWVRQGRQILEETGAEAVTSTGPQAPVSPVIV